MRYLIIAIILNVALVTLTIIAGFSQVEAFGFWNIIKVEIVAFIYWGCAVFLGMAISQFMRKKD